MMNSTSNLEETSRLMNMTQAKRDLATASKDFKQNSFGSCHSILDNAERRRMTNQVKIFQLLTESRRKKSTSKNNMSIKFASLRDVLHQRLEKYPDVDSVSHVTNKSDVEKGCDDVEFGNFSYVKSNVKLMRDSRFILNTRNNDLDLGLTNRDDSNSNFSYAASVALIRSKYLNSAFGSKDIRSTSYSSNTSKLKINHHNPFFQMRPKSLFKGLEDNNIIGSLVDISLRSDDTDDTSNNDCATAIKATDDEDDSTDSITSSNSVLSDELNDFTDLNDDDKDDLPHQLSLVNNIPSLNESMSKRIDEFCGCCLKSSHYQNDLDVHLVRNVKHLNDTDMKMSDILFTNNVQRTNSNSNGMITNSNYESSSSVFLDELVLIQEYETMSQISQTISSSTTTTCHHTHNHPSQTTIDEDILTGTTTYNINHLENKSITTAKPHPMIHVKLWKSISVCSI